MANDIQVKVLQLRKWRWKGIVKNHNRFGWYLEDAEQHTTTTTEKEWVDKGDRWVQETHTKTKVRVHVTLCREKSAFQNLYAIAIPELVFNMAMMVRAIIGAVLPIGVVLSLVLSLFGGALEALPALVFTYTGYAFGAWIGLIILEWILSLIAGAILKRS